MTTSPPTVETLTDVTVREQAAAAAAAAAARAGLEIIELDQADRIVEASTLLNVVWSASPDDPLIPANMLRAMTHAGNYAFAAYAEGQMVGAAVGFLGRLDGAVQLHSHILGVAPRQQGRSIGFALKQHQRAWALGLGLGTVTWTFDPLVRRNAYFNLAKLGAGIRAYYPNFYGPMNDGINGGDESDRVLVHWALDTPGVVTASVGSAAQPDLQELRNEGATVVLQEDDDGAPIAPEARGPVLLASIPQDIVRVRAEDRGLANRWRAALRDVLTGAIHDGYAPTEMTRSGWYVLRAGSGA